MHEDFEMGSPTWPRTPASPVCICSTDSLRLRVFTILHMFSFYVIIVQVFNSHTEPAVHRSSKKSDSLFKLYDMDDNPDRRGWLDKLLSFMEERRTPIAACPAISKQPLDLYKLYLLVKERGGFVEVCKVRSRIFKPEFALSFLFVNCR